jgi:hypothetical protein
MARDRRPDTPCAVHGDSRMQRPAELNQSKGRYSCRGGTGKNSPEDERSGITWTRRMIRSAPAIRLVGMSGRHYG